MNVTSSGFAKSNVANLYREAHKTKVLDTIRLGRITRTDRLTKINITIMNVTSSDFRSMRKLYREALQLKLSIQNSTKNVARTDRLTKNIIKYILKTN